MQLDFNRRSLLIVDLVGAFRLRIAISCLLSGMLIFASSPSSAETESEVSAEWKSLWPETQNDISKHDKCPSCNELPIGHPVDSIRTVLIEQLKRYPDEYVLGILGIDLDEKLECSNVSFSLPIDSEGNCPEDRALRLNTDNFEASIKQGTGLVTRYRWWGPLQEDSPITRGAAAITVNQILEHFSLIHRIGEGDVVVTKHTVQPKAPRIIEEKKVIEYVEECFEVVISQEHVPILSHFSIRISVNSGQVLFLLHTPGLPTAAPNVQFSQEQARQIALKYLKEMKYHRPYIEESRLSLSKRKDYSSAGNETKTHLDYCEWRYVWRVSCLTHYESGTDHAGQFLEWASGKKFWFGKMGSPTLYVDVETGEIIRIDE